MHFDMIMTGVKISLHEINKKNPILWYYSKGERKNVLIFPLNPAIDITLKRNSNYEGRLKTGIPEIHKYYVVYS